MTAKIGTVQKVKSCTFSLEIGEEKKNAIANGQTESTTFLFFHKKKYATFDFLMYFFVEKYPITNNPVLKFSFVGNKVALF